MAEDEEVNVTTIEEPAAKNATEVDVDIKKPAMTIRGYLVYNDTTDESNRENFVAFFGIPYAQPPTEKSKRFAAPEPFVYNSDVYGKPFKANKGLKMCPQLNESDNIVIIKTLGFDDALDCLRLNVYVPKKPEKIEDPLAVMVYFHGGGFYQGNGNYHARTPEFMIRYDVIIVTVNYRLGPFGFLNLQTEKCVGNAGLKDQVKALEWVRDNISCFGGDPDNVTIWGESAGGSCVNFHLISPLSKGLFKKAIIQSGGIYCPWGYTGDQRELNELYQKYAPCLREKKHAMLVDKLIEADYADILMFSHEMDLHRREPYAIDIYVGPSIETIPTKDAFLPCGPKELLENADPVPILAGITSQEGYITYNLAGPIFEQPYDWILNDDNFREFLKSHLHWEAKTIKKCFNELRKKYFNVEEVKSFVKRRASQREGSRSLGDEQQDRCEKNELDELNIKECLSNMCTDLWFYRFYDNIKLGAGSKKPALTYIYEFGFISRLNPSRKHGKKIKGTSHGDDIPYLLPNYLTKEEIKPFNKDEEKKIRTMCSLWASFAKTSIPKSDCHDTVWLPYSEEEPYYLKIGEDFEMRPGRMHDEHWIYLNELNRKDEKRKAKKLNSHKQNTVASFQMTLGDLSDAVNQAKSKVSLSEAAKKSESSTVLAEIATTSGSSNLSAPCHGGLDVSECSAGREGSSSSTLGIPTEEDLKRHSPSRSPTSENKTSSDESSKAKKERSCDEEQSQLHSSSTESTLPTETSEDQPSSG